MENLTEESPLRPSLSILAFFGVLILGYVVIAPRVGFFVALPFYPGDIESLERDMLSLSTVEYLRIPALIFQGTATLVGLIILPLLTLRFIVRERVNTMLTKPQLSILALVFPAVIFFIFPNSLIIDWNANLNFTGKVWDLAREFEDRATTFTKFITTFNSTGEFVLGLVVIAVLPALGEEFTFRGWLQPAVQKTTGNAHVAIWFTALFFSAFHFQFFGFVPRLLLGAMFGYFMYWSNNLWIPIVAHFVNNGFMVVMIYLHQIGSINFDAESPEALPWTVVIPATIIFIGLMFQLKKQITLREQTA
jgi:uncharacterized protein